jgi:hypothetical protein
MWAVRLKLAKLVISISLPLGISNSERKMAARSSASRMFLIVKRDPLFLKFAVARWPLCIVMCWGMPFKSYSQNAPKGVEGVKDGQDDIRKKGGGEVVPLLYA